MTPSKKWKAKSNTREILFGKIFENPNLNNTAYNFVPKNAMKLRFTKSFAQAFSKACGVLGQRPKVFNVNPLIKVLIKRIKFNFFQMEKWGLQELF